MRLVRHLPWQRIFRVAFCVLHTAILFGPVPHGLVPLFFAYLLFRRAHHPRDATISGRDSSHVSHACIYTRVNIFCAAAPHVLLFIPRRNARKLTIRLYLLRETSPDITPRFVGIISMKLLSRILFVTILLFFFCLPSCLSQSPKYTLSHAIETQTRDSRIANRTESRIVEFTCGYVRSTNKVLVACCT